MSGRSPTWPLIATAAGLLLSPVLELATGLALLYVFALTGLTVALWIILRFSRVEMGIRFGHWKIYLIALIYPLVVMGIAAAAAGVSGDVAFDSASLGRSSRTALLMFATTIIGALITEDGFFRGALWAVLRRNGISQRWTLLWTSTTFGLWHLPVAIIEPDFALPAAVIPVYVINAALIGISWGALRMVSGSIVTAAVCHALWNALAYGLFGYGTSAGLLGVSRYWLLGPERGVAGLVLNSIVACLLMRWAIRRGE